jgi:hypothetical protein
MSEILRTPGCPYIPTPSMYQIITSLVRCLAATLWSAGGKVPYQDMTV